jgi:hypothetical protein
MQKSNHTIWTQIELEPLAQFFKHAHITKKDRPSLTEIAEYALPDPYRFLLTQPMMTLGIAHYYQATPKIRPPLYIIDNTQNHTYSRAITMIVDSDKMRDDALLADQESDSIIVVLGMITINRLALPSTVIDDIMNTQIPFGALLAKARIKINHTNRRYFSIPCHNALAKQLHIDKNSVLYGRTNTLVHEDNQQWIARVVEILC